MNLYPVQSSPDLVRVAALRRRSPVDLASVRAEALVELMTSRLSLGPVQCSCKGRCLDRLKAVQAWALYEAPLAGGLVGFVGVGSGKTLMGILAPMVMPGCKVAVLLCPPGLVAQLFRDYKAAAQHFRVPSLLFGNDPRGTHVAGAPTLHVIPYSRLAVAKSTDKLNAIAPDLIIADEGQKLRHRDTATTSRVLRYLTTHKATRVCVWSGTLIGKSIKDVAHLLDKALHDQSPLPLDRGVVDQWATAIDPGVIQCPPGALLGFAEAGESVHAALHRRVFETLGVVRTTAGAIDASLNIFERSAPTLPAVIKTTLKDLRATWQRPDGEELVDALQVAKSAREVSCGFFYRWIFPMGEPVPLIERWFTARKAWGQELREKLKHRREHLDSPLLCAQAAQRSLDGYTGALPVWRSEAWAEWAAVKKQVKPESQAVWIDDFLINDAGAWAEKTRGVIWTEHTAFGAKLSAVAGLVYHGGGIGAEARILAETGQRCIIASIKSHGVGRDGLQRIFNEQLITTPPASGEAWEQLLGRLHRIGNMADEVNTHVYRHTPEMADAIDGALRQAKFSQEFTGSLQKLLAASFDWQL